MPFYDDDDSLDGYWHCTKCPWEGSNPGAKTYRSLGQVHIDWVYCPKCADGGCLEDGERPEVCDESEA
jgi:hypothetical protein